MRDVIALLRLTGLFFFFLSPSLARAQEKPNVEVSVGYSFLRLKPSQDVWIAPIPTTNNHGYQLGLYGNFTKHFGVALEFARQYGSNELPAGVIVSGTTPTTAPTPFKTDAANLMIGPRFAVRSERTTVFVQGLVGAAYTHLLADLPTGSRDASQVGFSYAISGGLDVNLNRHVALRVGQLGYHHVRHIAPLRGGQDNLQFSTGLVFRF